VRWIAPKAIEELFMIDQNNIDYFTEAGSVEAVNSRIAKDVDQRMTYVISCVVKHLHAFIKEVELNQEEWTAAISFLTDTGQICDEYRQEFILLSDVLGASMLVDAITNRRPENATENTVLGPFHVEGAPNYEMGENITKEGGSETCLFKGMVTDLKGAAVNCARIDVWSDNEDGFYDVQQPDVQPLHNNRGVFTTGEDGRYWFSGIKPVSYSIPDDGPVGQLLTKLGRHPFRPAHMHFVVSAPGYETVTTHTFVEGDHYLQSDAVFGVKRSLITAFAPYLGQTTKWCSTYDFILNPKDNETK
jgi:hydroxyquinol 1,2-dioxygenase